MRSTKSGQADLAADGAVVGAQTVERALQAIDVLAGSRTGLRLSDVAQAMGLNISTMSRVLGALDRYGYVQRESESGRYRLGFRLVQLGQTTLEQWPLPAMATPVLTSLMEESGETATVCVRQADRAVIVARVECANPLRSVAQIGSAGPLYCTGHGKVMLAAMAGADVDRILGQGMPRLTPLTIGTAEEMAAELVTIRTRGYAVDRGERDLELVSIAAPVWDAAGRLAATCGVSGSGQRIRPESVPTMAARVLASAATLTALLGGHGPDEGDGWTTP